MPTSQCFASQNLERAQVAFIQGLDKLRQSDYSGAIANFNLALQLNPEDPTIYGNRCVAQHRLGNVQEAIADCRQAAKLYLLQGNLKSYQYAVKILEKFQG